MYRSLMVRNGWGRCLSFRESSATFTERKATLIPRAAENKVSRDQPERERVPANWVSLILRRVRYSPTAHVLNFAPSRRPSAVGEGTRNR